VCGRQRGRELLRRRGQHARDDHDERNSKPEHLRREGDEVEHGRWPPSMSFRVIAGKDAKRAELGKACYVFSFPLRVSDIKLPLRHYHRSPPVWRPESPASDRPSPLISSCKTRRLVLIQIKVPTRLMESDDFGGSAKAYMPKSPWKQDVPWQSDWEQERRRFGPASGDVAGMGG
jgi:hypothetical protein